MRSSGELMQVRNSSIYAVLLALPGTVLAQVAPPPHAAPNGPAPVMQEPLQISYGGSVPTGQATAGAIALTLRDAIQRGLRYNLGALTSREIAETVKAERGKALRTLLPSRSVGVTQTSQQEDLAALGFNVPAIPT